MELSRDEIFQLYTAGTATVPKPFGAVGLVTIYPDGIELRRKKEPLVQVEHRISSTVKTTYLLPLERVAVILLEQNGTVNPSDGNWWLGQELAENDDQQYRMRQAQRGIVYVKESNGVFARFDVITSIRDLTSPSTPICGRFP